MTPSLIERLEPVTTGDAGRTARLTPLQREWLSGSHVYAFEWDKTAIRLASKRFIEWLNDYSASRRGFRRTDAGRAVLSSAKGSGQ